MDAPTLAVLLLLLLALGVLAVAWYRAKTRIARHNRARQGVARRGEEEAEALLARAGYSVVDRQVTGRFVMRIDDCVHALHCRADLLVERHGEQFVAEVKTGRRAPDPTHPATRRQLMEYLIAFPVHGVLLVDMESGRLRRIERWEAIDPEA